MTQPWLRQAELIIGPLYEWQRNRLQTGPSNEQEVLRVYSDGTQDTLRIKFRIQLHAGYISPASTIDIYNLSAPARAALNKPFTAVVLRAGWMNTGLDEIFSGSLVSAYSRREGVDIVTTIAAITGYGDTSRSYTSAPNDSTSGPLGPDAWIFPAGTTLKDVIKQLAGNMVGDEGVDDKLVEVPIVVMGSRGLSVFGKLSDILNDLARIYGFTWWIDGPKFRASTDGKIPSQPAQLVSYKNGMLLRAEPLLMGGWQQMAGIVLRSLLNPQIRCGGVVQVESQVNPFLNGAWAVQGLTHTGDTHSDSWYTDVESLVLSNFNGQ